MTRKFLFASCASMAMLAAPVNGLHAQAADASGGAVAAVGVSDFDTERARALVSQMTLDEKVAMVNAAFGGRARTLRPDDKRVGAGHGFGVPRLGIPELFESDASLGIANGIDMRPGDAATALPSALATGASFDPSLAYRGGAMIGAEARSKGFNVLLAGGVNLVRDPWGGRAFEYLGEDSWHSGVMGGAHIAGVQSNRIISTIKHFALNPQESGRAVANAVIPEDALRESDLLAFEIAIERGRPGSVMCSYNKVNGDYACENANLLNDVLKRDWAYPGWVMSDWGAVHSTAKAALAGLDQESGQELDTQVFFGAPLKAAVQSGAVPQSRLDDMVTRILRSMSAAGLLDDPAVQDEPIDQERHAAIAQQVAEQGMVLLRNERNLLPLAATARRIAVIGRHADKAVLSGGGSSSVRSFGGTPVDEAVPGGGMMSLVRKLYHASSPLAAIRARAPGAQLAYASGDDVGQAVEAARKADVVIIFAEQWRSEMVDVETLALPGNQNALIQAVAATNPKTVVVLETGGPVLMPWLDQVGAVLEAWYPGQRGGQAIARILFGDVNPSGRLPVTFPASDDQAPRPQIPGLAAVKAAAAEAAKKPPVDINSPDFVIDMTGGVAPFDIVYNEGADVGYRWYQRTNRKPLFPFGFGLSYTSFRYSDLKLGEGGEWSVAFTVTNSGTLAGADVPQVYAAPGSDGNSVYRLVGFQKVYLQPGESRRIALSIDPRTVAAFDTAQRVWSVRGGPIGIRVGRYAGDTVLTAKLNVAATQLRP